MVGPVHRLYVQFQLDRRAHHRDPAGRHRAPVLAARSVALPALRERPEDIRELLSALAPRPAPGGLR
ncbi:hypothetical protein A6P39_005435 [Streptomyces sp. FXJ1.172]|nr:hypothetical protein [Streptomyces sp. FXJ1.172]WEP00504.1 hypothetical protein A6P39_005435 [Streptomyces sp. FXJ1.172]